MMDKRQGEITVVLGPMYSGKTTEAIRLTNRYRLTNRVCISIKHQSDHRYEEEGRDAVNSSPITHDGKHFSPDGKSLRSYRFGKVMEAFDDIATLRGVDVVCIDEGHFFEDLAPACEMLVRRGIDVIISALMGSFKRKMFPSIVQILPCAEKVVFARALCEYCHRDASFTHKTTDSVDVIEVGGKELYRPCCRDCFDRPQLPFSPRSTSPASQGNGTPIQ